MAPTTRASLDDFLLDTYDISSNEHDDVLLILHDGSVWLVLQDEDGDGFYLISQRFESC